MSSTPSIRISRDPRRHSPTGLPPTFSSTASPMAIPRAHDLVPPPLPPPAWIPEIHSGQDPGWQWGNDPNGADFGRPASVKPGSSLLGTAASKNMRSPKEQDSLARYRTVDARRGSSISTVTPGQEQEPMDHTSPHSDDDALSARPTSNGLQGERQLEQRALEQSSQSYDKQLLSRIGGPNTPTRQSLSQSSGSLLENGQLGPHDRDRRHSSLRPLSLPDGRHGSIDSPSGTRWPPSSGVVSPGYTGYWQDSGPEYGRAFAAHRESLTSEDNASHRGSYDHAMFINDDFGTEDGQMSNLNIHDRSPGSPQAGSKRRASSPQRDREDRLSISSAPGPNEIYHRRSMQQLPNRNSPVSRFHPNHSSVSSASSIGHRHGSLGSSLGLSSVPSSATSYASGRLSPGALSPAAESDARYGGTPYSATKAMNPTSPLMRHQRTLSESTQGGSRKLSTSTESVAHSRNGSLSHMQGTFICECCPKKPKKFESEEELRLHESEKQYMCSYCSNRFKNKNEAERHQNSLHLRKHSWSCAALTGIEAAFHSSSNGTDTCGYCGFEFPNPPQWDVRAEHLNHVHKFGECNQAKKFYRADHFRQHLKHSHQGTSGKWTNILENACVKDETPPERRPVIAIGEGMPPPSQQQQPPPALMVTTSGLGSVSPGRIEETPHES